MIKAMAAAYMKAQQKRQEEYLKAYKDYLKKKKLNKDSDEELDDAQKKNKKNKNKKESDNTIKRGNLITVMNLKNWKLL